LFLILMKPSICNETEMPVVIKADVLRRKGVFICDSSQEAITALTKIMTEGAFGAAAAK